MSNDKLKIKHLHEVDVCEKCKVTSGDIIEYVILDYISSYYDQYTDYNKYDGVLFNYKKDMMLKCLIHIYDDYTCNYKLNKAQIILIWNYINDKCISNYNAEIPFQNYRDNFLLNDMICMYIELIDLFNNCKFI